VIVALLAVAILVFTQWSKFFGWPLEEAEIKDAFYIPVTLAMLTFIVVGLVLPRILRFKVGGIELEKTAVSQVSAPSSLGISR
jgi:hypothetical protein